MSKHVVVKRWFQRGPGNTYHSVSVYEGDELVSHEGKAYGGGDMWLATFNRLLGLNYGSVSAFRKSGMTLEVKDVKRLRELRPS